MPKRLLRPVGALISLLSVASVARAADPVPSLDLRGWRAPTDAASGVYLEPASTPDTFEYNVGAWIGYSYQPVTLLAADGEVQNAVIRHQVTSDFTGLIGFGRRVALGFDLPVLVAQTGDEPDAVTRSTIGETAVPLAAVGDLGLVAKLTLIRPTGGEFGGFALALHNRFTVPTGDDASFLGEGAITNEMRALAEYRLVAIGIHAALGFKLRAEEEEFGCAAVPLEECESRFGHELPFGLGLTLRPQALGIDDAGRWLWFVETYGHVPVSPREPFSTSSVSEAQLVAGARLTMRDISVLAGVETALVGGIGNPQVRVVGAVGWAPRLRDADNDGVEDDKDQCRELAEDRDRFQDEDGCPEGDNDDDGVPDGEDRCPADREDEDGFQDDDGCEDPDNDGDGVLDAGDACPNDAGPRDAKPKPGCPVKDMDGDGIEGEKDQCPDKAEDKDGFADEDGCPDDDNDADGVPDAQDACPDKKGVDSTNPKENGCPDADRDDDAFRDDEDKCPDSAETFNGIEDTDGCPEDGKKGTPVVKVRNTKDGPAIEMSGAVKFTEASEIDPATLPLVRALAAELRKRRTWGVAVGVRPSPKGGPDGGVNQAMTRSFAVVATLRKLVGRDGVAETVGWAAVSGQPGAEAHGIGWLVLEAQPEAKPDATSTPNKPAEPGKPAASSKPVEPKKVVEPKPAEPTKPPEPSKPATPKK